MVLINNRRRLERRARWALFLLFAIAWSVTAWSLGLLPVSIGILLLAVALLQAWTDPRIPVLAYHSVSEDGSWLNKPGLVIPVTSFRKQIAWLANHNYTTLTLDDLQARRTSCTGHRKTIALTFDDGYLDNWIAVEPILREHKMRGTVFVSTAWIEVGAQCRPKLTNGSADRLTWSGYLNTAEIRALKDGGVLDIQSHAVSHDAVFCSDRIIGFAKPGRQPQWLIALLNPARKSIWYKLSHPVPAGYPLFSTGEALAVPAFFPDPEFIKEITQIAADTSFFMRKDWQQTLHEAADQYRLTRNGLGRMETDAETHRRWRLELEESKRILEEITGCGIDHLCWPRDAFCPESEKLAFSLGYKSVTAGGGFNGCRNPNHVGRLYVEGCGVSWLDLGVFILQIWLSAGRIWVWPILALGSRLIRLMRHLRT